jgi:predicted nucleotidyltransferase component of viral defense system
VKSPLDDLLSGHRLDSVDAVLQALREIIQQITLLGLWRGKFFEHAAFYGGTAMRIIHGLPRYSEDMDFSLLLPDLNFKLKPYIPYLKEELQAFGLDVSIEQKTGSADTAIESAFVKMNTRTGFLKLGVPPTLVERLSREQILKVKFEIDIDPPKNFLTETKFLYTPQAFSVRLFDLPSMFAGKLHAAIARAWKTRVKGRDWFDVVWFVGKDVSASLAHFKARLIQTGQLDGQASFTEKEARELLSRRIEALDIEAAKRDVRPFLTLKDADQLNIWSRVFFLDLAARVKFGDEEQKEMSRKP